MPVKKTTTKVAAKKTVAKKTTAAKRPVAKKVVKKVATKKIEIRKPSVIVETKKTTKASTCIFKQEWTIKILFVLLLLWNLVFGVLNFMKQDSALELEEMKVGGHDNFVKVMQLYESNFYKEQQSAAIQQFMGQANQPAQQQAAPQIENLAPAE